MNIGTSPVPTSPVSHSGRSLVPTSQLDISHHVSEDLVPVQTPLDNAPNALAATPTRSGFLERTSRMLFGGTGPRQQEESNVTERRRAVDPDAVPPFPSEEQQLRQLQLNAAADVRQRPQGKAEPAELDAALASSRPRTPTWERASASLESSPNLSPPRDHRSPRRSASPQAEMTSACGKVASTRKSCMSQAEMTSLMQRDDLVDATFPAADATGC
jgi:hypothetical protein